MKQRLIGTFFILLLLSALITFGHSESFSRNPEAINEAAKSVMMLEIYDDQLNYIGSGSGFVAFDSGYLLTNYHVVKDGFLIFAYSDDGTPYYITEVLCADSNKDICILCFRNATGLKPLELNYDSEGLMRASQVVAIGSPLGFSNTVSIGNISGLYNLDNVSYIRFTAPISHGSSGGALFDDNGLVIGITSASYVDGQNLNEAVSISEAIDLMIKCNNFEPVSLESIKQNDVASTPITSISTQKPTPTAAPELTTTPVPKQTAAPTSTPSPESTPTPRLRTTPAPKQTAEPTSAPTQKPTPTPNPVGKNTLKFTVLQYSEGTVLLSWENKLSKEVYYWYAYEESQYYHYGKTKESKIKLYGFIPGKKCTFGICTSESAIGESENSITIRINATRTFSDRGFSKVSDELFFVKKGDSVTYKSKNQLSTIRLSLLISYLKNKDFYYGISFRINESKDDSIYRTTIALYDPEGNLYDITYEPIKVGYKNNGTQSMNWKLNDLFADIKDFGKITKGTYKLKLYINGYLAFSTNLQIS
ncbi:MAG: trypsin-like peptidase domain-containing protein [Clostridia bacterium]|nr:trypsin-like peptidase domain-containing protein [Clostridia bacterium]